MEAPGPLLDESSGCGRRGRRLDPWSQWGISPPEIRAPRSLRALDRLFQGADRVVGAPWAQVDHPSAVRAAGGGSRGAAGQWGRPFWALRRRQVFLDPSAASERLVPQGEDPPASTAASDTDFFEGGRDRAA